MSSSRDAGAAAPPTERELKFADVDHSALRERLLALEAECEGSPALEDNWIFDQDGRLQSAGSVLRLRVDRRGARLTVKGPATFEDQMKIRTELETGVDDAQTLRAILEALGFSATRRYQKYREIWHLGSITISVDHTPIGDFAEFEGENCETVARRCGLDPAQAEPRSYLALYEDHVRSHPDAPPDMLFPPKERGGVGTGATPIVTPGAIQAAQAKRDADGG